MGNQAHDLNFGGRATFLGRPGYSIKFLKSHSFLALTFPRMEFDFDLQIQSYIIVYLLRLIGAHYFIILLPYVPRDG